MNANSLGEFVAVFGVAAHDGRSLLENLADQNYQSDITRTPGAWTSVASLLGALAASALIVADKLSPLILSEMGKMGLAANIISLGANVSMLTMLLNKPSNEPGVQNAQITAGLGVLSALAGTASSFDALMVGAGLAAQFPWAVSLAILATSISLVWQRREVFVWATNELFKAYEEALDESTFTGDLARSIRDRYISARGLLFAKDPFVLDLDSDGIETVGITSTTPILFDHDADGTRTGTGWIKPDDGLLVLDRNGLIDSGRELFGDETLLPNGYAALAQYDANGDGRISSADAVYAELRVWQDANQDGISQASELRTLVDVGIASMGVQGTQSNVNLGNGNTMPLQGTFTRTDGSAGTSGVAELSGSGWVRDLHEAMSGPCQRRGVAGEQEHRVCRHRPGRVHPVGALPVHAPRHRQGLRRQGHVGRGE